MENTPEMDPLLRTADPRHSPRSGIRVKKDGTLETEGTFFPAGSRVRVDLPERSVYAVVQGDRFTTPPNFQSISYIEGVEGKPLYADGVGWGKDTAPGMRERIIDAVREKYGKLDLPGLSNAA